jgi:hypothetical protein
VASNWSGALGATEVREDEQITDALNGFARGDNEQRTCCAERFVRSIKESCLERMNLFDEDALRNGDRGGSLTDFVPASASVDRNSAVNSGSGS